MDVRDIIAALEKKRSRGRMHPVLDLKKGLRKGSVLPVISIAKEQQAGIYSAPHLPPLQIKVSQVEIEAGDCEGRLPLLFWNPGFWSLIFDLWQGIIILSSRLQSVDSSKTKGQRPKSKDQRPKPHYERRNHCLSNIRRQW